MVLFSLPLTNNVEFNWVDIVAFLVPEDCKCLGHPMSSLVGWLIHIIPLSIYPYSIIWTLITEKGIFVHSMEKLV